MIDQYRNQIVTGDALALLRTLPDESIPMFLLSPPYNMGKSAGGGLTQYKPHYGENTAIGKRGGSGKWERCDLSEGYEAHGDGMEWSEYTAWQQEILAECWRALTPAGAIFYQHKPRQWNGETWLPIRYAPPALTLRQVVIWARAGGINFSPANYMPTHEWLCIYAKSEWRLKSKGASGVGDVWYIPQESGTWHPAPFPLALATRALETVMPALVCDPFMGSGTTAKAAVKLGIDYIGFELSEKYAARARKEIAELESQPRLIPIEAKQERMELDPA